MTPAERAAAIHAAAERLLGRPPAGVAAWSVGTIARFKADVAALRKARALPAVRDRAAAVAAHYGKTIADLDPDPDAPAKQPTLRAVRGELEYGSWFRRE